MDVLESQRLNRIFRFLVYIADVAIITLVFWILYFLWGEFEGYSAVAYSPASFCALLGCCYLSCNLLGRMIFTNMRIPGYRIIIRIFKNIATFAIASYFILSLTQHDFFSDTFMAIYFIGCFVSLIFFRLLLRKLLRCYNTHHRNRVPVVMVGGTANVAELALKLQSDAAAYTHIAGYFANSPSAEFDDQFLYLGTPDLVKSFLASHKSIRMVYCALPSNQSQLILSIIDYCEKNVIQFFSVPNVSNYLRHPMHFQIIDDVPVLSLRRIPLNLRENRLVKRIFDIAFSGLFLCTIFPFIWLIFGFLIKLSSPGPIFFKQKRNGINGDEFYCYKFRSMRQSAEADTKQATLNDPRKTRVGEFMRRTSIDELPQFINVFLGNMSVVGPRPHMVKHTEEYGEKVHCYMVRHFIKPGVTGWAQVTGFRGETKELAQMEGRIKADIWYLENWNFALDLYIIFKTVKNGLRGEKNAY